MPNNQQAELLKLADDLMEKTGNPIKVASNLRDEMNKRYGPAWQCVVGRDFSRHSDYFVLSSIGCIPPAYRIDTELYKNVIRFHVHLSDTLMDKQNGIKDRFGSVALRLLLVNMPLLINTFPSSCCQPNKLLASLDRLKQTTGQLLLPCDRIVDRNHENGLGRGARNPHDRADIPLAIDWSADLDTTLYRSMAELRIC
ncbi:hypothetical protein CLF_105138 [Clonorchis sinensis]|uniref:Dynein light chain n=1 Tax=Clonorchis sinensis TaxID=79923 RepID=G7YD16_CLOSI|nr:hypothetical protein CLF_105138 [Clonorchis sinensis]